MASEQEERKQQTGKTAFTVVLAAFCVFLIYWLLLGLPKDVLSGRIDSVVQIKISTLQAVDGKHYYVLIVEKEDIAEIEMAVRNQTDLLSQNLTLATHKIEFKDSNGNIATFSFSRKRFDSYGYTPEILCEFIESAIDTHYREWKLATN